MRGDFETPTESGETFLRRPAGASSAGVRIKGTRRGVTVMVRAEGPAEAMEELRRRLEEAAAFLRGNEVVLDVDLAEAEPEGIRLLWGVLEQYGLKPVLLVSDNPAVRRAAYALGIRVQKAEAEKPEYALVKHGPIRAGQTVNHSGAVLIIGDVNPGAEVIAGGDIVVWGRLKGTAYAGAPDDPTRRIYALAMEPTLLRIGPYLGRPPEEDEASPHRPEVAMVQDERIVVEPWR